MQYHTEAYHNHEHPEGGDGSMKNHIILSILSTVTLYLQINEEESGRSDRALTHQFLEGGGAGQRVEEREGLVGDAPQLGALRREARDLREGLLQREEAETLM